MAPTSQRAAGGRRRPPARSTDAKLLVGAVLFLVCLGLVMVYSATSARAVIFGADPISPVQKQALYAILGFAVLALCLRVRTDALKHIARPAVGAALLMLALVLVLPPTMAPEVNGATRWLVFGGFQIQPSEVAKLALILWIAAMVAERPKLVRAERGLVPFFGVSALFAVLVVVEPDLGTASIIMALAFAMVFVAGAPLRTLGIIAGVGVGLAVLTIAISPYQRARVESFLDPWAQPTGQSFQNVQAQIAIGSGGVVGRGLGNSIQKNNYLPEAHTDMIGAIIGEELGLVGMLSMMLAFVVIGIVGFRIALRAKSVHLRMLGVGITTMLCLQAAINLAQVLGAFPITGVPLPFVSAGGTNLLVSLAGIGILVNIAHQGAHASARRARPSASGSDRGGRDGRPRQAGTRNRRRLAS